MKPFEKLLIFIILILCAVVIPVQATDYIDVLPPDNSSTYIKATSTYTAGDPNYKPWFTVDNYRSLVGQWGPNQWISEYKVGTYNVNQRFSIDLGSAYRITKMNVSNAHDAGATTDWGAKNFTFYCSNTSGDFADTTYASTGNWAYIPTSATAFDRHPATNTVQWQEITLTNSMSCRYYSFKFADNYGGTGAMGVRHITLKTEPFSPLASFSSKNITQVTNSTSYGWEGARGLQMVFNDTSKNTPTSWNYTATNVTGDNIKRSIGTTKNLSYIFNYVGNYSIRLTSENSIGSNESVQQTWVNVTLGRSITADFSVSNTSGIQPLLTHFTDLSTTNEAEIDTWSWDFGDGNTSTSQNTDHTYVNNGTYSANLTITNTSFSLVSSKLATITVFNVPPVADFTASNLSGTPPLLVQFTDTSTGENIYEWNWSFGDGNISSLQNPLYTFDSIGEYQVNLTVTNDGGSSTKLRNITVALFGAYFTANQTTGTIPLPVLFTDTSIGEYDTWNWSVDDGVLQWFNKTNPMDKNLEYTFNNAGNWRINLSVQNIALSGPIYSTSMNITATNIPPVASFVGYPSAGTTDTIFIFNDTTPGVVYSWSWDFGDGNTSATRNATHMFPSNGIYQVNLTVSNDGGASYVVHPFTVSNFSVTTYIYPSSGVIPFTANFTETYSGLIPDSYYWEFGDGATSTNKNDTHTYTSIGTFNVNHRVVNDSTILWYNTSAAITSLGGSVSANFTANATDGDYPLAVQFTDTSLYTNATPYSWYWTFGDGLTSTLQHPAHLYSNAGVYSVNFTTNTDYGSSSILKTNYIHAGGDAANGRQDIILTNSYNITLYVKDANTGNLISYAMISDELGRELTPYGNGAFTGYYTAGQHSFSANATNYYSNRATYLVNGNLIQTIYLTPISTSVSTTWYSPKTIIISVTDVYGNYLDGAIVNAHYNETTLPNGVSDLISNYGMNPNVANEALNGTLIMSGSTDYQGGIVFTMLSTVKYDVAITYGGQTNYYSIYPQNPTYLLKFISVVETDNIWDDLYANGNTKVWATEPDAANVTFWWSFQDMTDLTTRIDFYLQDVDLDTMVYIANVTSPIAGNIYQLNYTLPNVRGKNYLAWENYTRDV